MPTAVRVNRLSCPKCHRRIEDDTWQRDGLVSCQHCLDTYELVPFPAFVQANQPAAVAAEQAMAEDATCFFHSGNRAEKVCSSCGRYLCPVCAINYGGETLCASCIEHGHSKAVKMEKSRVLWDGWAAALAVLPMIMWPLTCLSAPAALACGILAWRRPTSLVSKSRIKVILAMFLATLQIIAWVVVIIKLILEA